MVRRIRLSSGAESTAPTDDSRPGRASLRGRLSTLAGVAGAGAAAVVGGEADAVTYIPTSGVVAAQGIPGFTFVDEQDVTLGALRPPATANTGTNWDIDGSGSGDLTLFNEFSDPEGPLVRRWAQLVGRPNTFGVSGRLLKTQLGTLLLNLAQSVSIKSNMGAGYNWNGGLGYRLTYNGGNLNGNFTTGVSGQFGFYFETPGGNRYGWASLVIDGTPQGQGYVITEAYYQTSGAPIKVGAVPAAVPEPSSIALLGLGAAGIAAWRARRKAQRVIESGAEV